MKMTKNYYPIFAANQVLTNSQLNQVIGYLDEQERLTRTNLIGVGIVCGLEAKFDDAIQQTKIILSKGCGVTSKGYLIVEPNEIEFIAYRNYTLPEGVEYPLFENLPAGSQLLELVTADEATNLTPLSPEILATKALIVFFELKENNARNCTVNNCDAQGGKMTATTRHLLIDKNVIVKDVAGKNNVSINEVHNILTARLNLPELKMRRFDVPNTNSIYGEKNIYQAFVKCFPATLIHQLKEAMSLLYKAFKPILKEFSTNPFEKLELLENQSRIGSNIFFQCYYDCIHDLMRAYEEARLKGIELLCECCPDELLFPSHLTLGIIHGDTIETFYRDNFIASAVSSNCGQHSKEFQLLFKRLEQMVKLFTLPNIIDPETKQEVPIRITPSFAPPVALSKCAIPYYYLQNSNFSIYELWDVDKTRLNKVGTNLSYYAPEYQDKNGQLPPAFIREPLCYVIDDNAFLRVEGHLGKNYKEVMNELLTLKRAYRLPIDIIALRTGTPSNTNTSMVLASGQQNSRDLELAYQGLRAELVNPLRKNAQLFYSVKLDDDSKNKHENSGKSNAMVRDIKTIPDDKLRVRLPLLHDENPDYKVLSNTVGYAFEKSFPALSSDVTVNMKFILASVLEVSIDNLKNKNDPNVISTIEKLIQSVGNDSKDNQDDGKYNGAQIVNFFIAYASLVYDALPENINDFNFNDFEKYYSTFLTITDKLAELTGAVLAKESNINKALVFSTYQTNLSYFNYHSLLDKFKNVADALEQRTNEITKNQLLSSFMSQHPGINHMAGVPLGGTFIIVYHVAEQASSNSKLRNINVVPDGVVIADFFLPYQCSANYPLPSLSEAVAPGFSADEGIELRATNGLEVERKPTLNEESIRPQPVPIPRPKPHILEETSEQGDVINPVLSPVEMTASFGEGGERTTENYTDAPSTTLNTAPALQAVEIAAQPRSESSLQVTTGNDSAQASVVTAQNIPNEKG